MDRTIIDSLPEELQLQIFTLLDSPPPSILKVRWEPSLDLTSSPQHALKDISLVSKRWRRIVLPLLFKNARLCLDGSLNNSPREWSGCSICHDYLPKGTIPRTAKPSDHEPFHTDMMEAVKKCFLRKAGTGDTIESRIYSRVEDCNDPQDELKIIAWASRFYHTMDDFLAFIKHASLAVHVQTFVLLSDKMLDRQLGGHSHFPHLPSQREWRYPAAAGLWQHLLSVIDLQRIVILATPTDLACLTNASIEISGDWAFTDMKYHILELKLEPTRPPRLMRLSRYNELEPFPEWHRSFAYSSVINARPWTDFGLNEGSFLKAYGTYEFFERGPPSLVHSITSCFYSASSSQSHKLDHVFSFPMLRSFTYTGIFPFYNHATFYHLLPFLEEIDLQYAPDPQSGILDDKERTGKAELQDCWQELVSAYHNLASAISTFRMSEARFPKLKRVVCRDFRIRALQDDLDEIFTPLCLPVWAEVERGVFQRLAMSPRLPADDYAP